ncbi:membrane protein [Candidatus Magnetomorum sp. HK-1]|nr:membrane protein [Candidatus Magnetomorum sp. HK-1]
MLNLFGNFLKTVLYRDFWPIKGQQESFEHFIQCKLYIYGSILILLILFFSGFRFLGTYNGLKDHLSKLEENPFASAILIKGSFERTRLNDLKNGLFYNTQTQEFSETKDKNCIPAILGVYPYNIIHLYFLHKDFSIFHDTYDILTVKVPNESSQKNDADHYIKKWITDNLQSGTNFFHPEQAGVNRSMIISPSLAKKLGYDPEQMPDTQPIINFLDTKQDLIEDRKEAKHHELWGPLDEMEKIKYTNHAKLLDIFKQFSGGDAIITEGFYYHLCKKYTFDPCQAVDFFYIKRTEGKFNKSEVSIVNQWAFKHFGNNNIDQPFLFANKREFKCQFSTYSGSNNVNTKCNIRMGLKDLTKKIPGISLDFRDDDPAYDDQEMLYYYAYLYINKDQRILDNISKLIHFLKKRFQSYLDDNQVMTLIKYRKDMQKMDAIFWWFFIGFVLLLITYIVVTFTLLLQTKRHQIGMFKSMGASSFKLINIYIYEAIILIVISLTLAFILSVLIPAGEFYSFNYYVWLYILCILGLTVTGAGFSAWHIVTRQPYQLISYQT